MNWPKYQCIVKCLLTLEIGDRRQVIIEFNFPAGFEGTEPTDWWREICGLEEHWVHSMMFGHIRQNKRAIECAKKTAQGPQGHAIFWGFYYLTLPNGHKVHYSCPFVMVIHKNQLSLKRLICNNPEECFLS